MHPANLYYPLPYSLLPLYSLLPSPLLYTLSSPSHYSILPPPLPVTLYSLLPSPLLYTLSSLPVTLCSFDNITLCSVAYAQQHSQCNHNTTRTQNMILRYDNAQYNNGFIQTQHLGQPPQTNTPTQHVWDWGGRGGGITKTLIWWR